VSGAAEGQRRWRRARDRGTAGAFLRAREPYCVVSCSRFLAQETPRELLWTLDGAGEEGEAVGGVLLQSRRALLPVLADRGTVPAPRFLTRLLHKIPVHLVQGLTPDTAIFEGFMAEAGRRAVQTIDYDLMALDREPADEALRAGPPGILIRPPEFADIDDLFAMQAAYEYEEVLPEGAAFSPALCRQALDRILVNEQILVAEWRSRVIGKVNTNARSFTRSQIGGVFVRPEYRGMGVATRMSAVFARALRAQGRGVSLFVKKRNAAARAVYRHTGFHVLGDYRITYY
jgi:ribosomal protein S18 acetylase RimI-like enzyme